MDPATTRLPNFCNVLHPDRGWACDKPQGHPHGHAACLGYHEDTDEYEWAEWAPDASKAE